MTLTAKQEEALDVLLGSSNSLLYGGARSGKTALVVYFIIFCCLQFKGSRMLIARRYATDIRSSIWNDTLVKVMHLQGLELGKDYKTNEQQQTVSFPNGSEIICAGLDDKERVDKILGTEYALIYINESQDISWATIKTLKTRLAQRINGFKNRFICDLNPTSINHWTYKLWFEGINPETNAPVTGSYGKIQMNPMDNKENLSDDFITEQLEGLTGQERTRFLLGEYSTNSDLQVFIPKTFYEDDDFLMWAEGKWRDLRITGGLDLGFEDADAFIMLAYVDGESDIWLLDEYKGYKNDITTLGKDITHMVNHTYEKYPFNLRARDDFQIWTDTGGLGRKTASELAETFELPVRAAYKRDKDVGIFFLQDDVNNGRLHIHKDGPFADECKKVVWSRDTDSGKIEKKLDDNAYHPDLMDAIIYAYRFLMQHGNEAMIGRTVDRIKDEGPKDYFDIQAQVMAALGQESQVW
jgi:PBSX family phage terminase large subunit